MRRLNLILFFLLIVDFYVFGAGYKPSGPFSQLTVNRSGGNCANAILRSVTISNIYINITSKASATLSFTNSTSESTVSKTSLKGTLSGNSINFETFTVSHRLGCSADVKITFRMQNSLGNASIAGTYLIEVTNGIQSVASSQITLNYYNGFNGEISEQAYAIAYNPSNANILSNGTVLCTNNSIRVQLFGDNYKAVTLYIDNKQLGSTVEPSNEFSVNLGSINFEISNGNLGLNLADGLTHEISLDVNGVRKQVLRFTTYSPFTGLSITSSKTTSCYGEPITLTANVSGSNLTYNWSDGGTSGPSRTINNPINGNYSVIVTKSGVCPMQSNNLPITVVSDFTAIISANKQQACEGESIQIVANPNNSNNFNYSWSGGGSSSSILVSKNDNYRVTITPKIGNCGSRTSNTINNLVFDKRITGENITIPSGKTKAIICANENALILTANADELNNVKYSWSGLKTGNAQTLSVTATGEYSLVLSRGACVSSVKKISVIGNTVPRITPDPADLRVCRGQAVKFSTIPNDKSNFAYEWYGGTGTTLITGKADPNLDVSEPGTYRLVLKPVGAGCTQFNETKVNVAVDENIKGALNYTGSAVICNTQKGLDLIASGTGTNISYKWSTGATTAKITVSTAGTYKVTMTRGKCVEEQTVSTQIKDLEAKIATIDKNPAGLADTGIIVCTGTNYQSYELKATSNFTSATYLWKKDNANAPNATTGPTYLPTSAGRYFVYAEVKELGCISKTPSNVFVVTTPTNFSVNISPLNPPAICEGTSITLTAARTYASNLIKYEWMGTSTKTNTLSSKLEGNYTVNINQEGCKASNSSRVTTKPSKPTVAIVDENLLISSSSTDSNYEWFFKPLPVSANTADYNLNSPVGRNQQYLVDGVSKFGAYIVRANRNGCGRVFSDPFAVNSIILSNSTPSNQTVTIYPNPIFQTINIHDEQAAKKTIQLFSLDGKLIKIWQSEEKNTMLNIEDFQAGGYLIKIESQNKSITKKILKI